MKKSKISQLAPSFRYLQTLALKYYSTVLFNFTVLNIFVSCLDILVSEVFRVKPSFCEHFLIVPRTGIRPNE